MAYFDPDGQTVSVESLRASGGGGLPSRESSVEVEGGEAMHYPPPAHPSYMAGPPRVSHVPAAPQSGDPQMQVYLEQQAILQQQQQLQLQQLQHLQQLQLQQLQAQQVAPPVSQYPYPPPHVRMSVHPTPGFEGRPGALAAVEAEPPESNKVKFLAMGLAIGAVVVLLLSGNGLNQIRATLAYALMPATPAPAAQPPAMPTVPPPPPAAPVAVAPVVTPAAAPVAVVAAPAARPILEVDATRLPHAAPVAHAGTKKPPRAPKEDEPDAPAAPAAGAEPVPGSMPLDIGAFSKGLGSAFKGGDSLGGGGGF